MMLNDSEIRRLCSTGMITNFVVFGDQLQANGFDLTLDRVSRITGPGAIIDFSNKNRVLPETEDIPFEDAIEYPPRVVLTPGVYIFHSSEILEMPNDVAAIGVPRSSMSRCGNFVQSAAIDAGYRGRLIFPVLVTIPTEFYFKARFIQLLFYKLIGDAKHPYDGIFKEKK